MFQNNNKAICRKIVKNSLAANRSRNVFIILAVMLTTFMVGAVFSVGMGLLASIEAQQTRLVGSVAHAALGNPTAEQYMQAQKLDYVKKVGYGVRVGSLWDMPLTESLDANLIYMDDVQWKDIQSPAFTDVVGTPPTAADEIMAPRYVLDKMGIAEPTIGMEIPLRFTTDGGVTVYEKTFRLSGYFTSYMQVSTGSWQFILVAREAVYAYEKPEDPQSALNFIFKDKNNIIDSIERLKADLQIPENQPILPSTVYYRDAKAQAASFAIMLILVALFVLTGYLLIYNVLYISVSRDIRFFGLLKTIGTTPRQIKRIVIMQVLRLCAIGIPVGLALAVLASFAVVPAVVQGSDVTTGVVISFSPLIFIGATLFALATALIGAISPAKKAARISPIDAVRISVKTNRAKAANAASAQGKPLKMAVRNVRREKKRVAVVLMSLFLGMTTFLSVTTLIGGMDIERYIDSYYNSDFMLENRAYTRRGDLTTQVFTDELMQAVAALPGVEHIELITSAFGEMTYMPEMFEAYLQDFFEKQQDYGGTWTMEQMIDNFIGVIGGLDRTAVEKLNEEREVPIDVDAFMRGEMVLVATDTPALFANVHEIEMMMVDINGTTMEGNAETFTMKVGGFVPLRYKYIGDYVAPTIFVSNAYWEVLDEVPLIRSVYLDVSDECEAQADGILSALLEDNADIEMVSKTDARKGLEDAKIILTVLGGGLALILAFIGVMNFINVMSVNVVSRRREFAILQSIGMTGRTLRKMLRYEGILYALTTFVLVATIGNGIAYGLFKLFQRQADYIVFQYPLIPMTAIALVILAVCVAVPEMAYRTLSRATIVERLREVD